MRGSTHDLPVAAEIPDGGGAIRQAQWGSMSAELGTVTKEMDPGPLFLGLPDDRCQCPHWGYVIKGQLRYTFADRVEVFNAGDAYYVGPGHLPEFGNDTEYIEFSPTDLLEQTMEVVGRNFEQMIAGVGA